MVRHAHHERIVKIRLRHYTLVAAPFSRPFVFVRMTLFGFSTGVNLEGALKQKEDRIQFFGFGLKKSDTVPLVSKLNPLICSGAMWGSQPLGVTVNPITILCSPFTRHRRHG